MRRLNQQYYKLFSIQGIPVGLNWSVLLWAVEVVREPRIITACSVLFALFIVLLIHELGHLFVARALGYRVFTIVIYFMYGLCTMERPDNRADRALVYCGGIFAQLLLFLLTIILLNFISLQEINSILGQANEIVVVLVVANPLIMILNLLPIQPLDGVHAWEIIPAAISGELGIHRLANRIRQKTD